MKILIINILAAIILALSTSCGVFDGNSEEIDSLQTLVEQLQDENLEQRAKLNVYHININRFGTYQDSIRMREMAIDSLKSVIKQQGRTTKEQGQLLNSLVTQIQDFLSKNREVASNFQSSGYKDASAQQLLNMMFSVVETKQAEVERLENEVKQLTKRVTGLEHENANLHQQNQQLTDQVAETAKAKAKAEEAASLRTLSNVKINLPDVRKAKKVDSINVKFSINENSFAPTGNVTVYIRITDQNGNLLHNSESDMFNYEGKSIACTTKKSAYFSGKKTPMNVTWHTDGITLLPGQYTVTFFMDDREAETTTFLLKK